jgi:hypothetical protein
MRTLAVVLAIGFTLGCGPSKQEFIDGFGPALSADLCKPAAYFRQCFQVTEGECTERVQRLVKVCLDEHASEMPERFDSQSGERVGRVVGACAGGRYEVELAQEGRRTSSARCNDPQAWVPH